MLGRSCDIAVSMGEAEKSKVVLRGRRSTLDTLGVACCVFFCIFCELHCQGCVKWWQRADRVAGVGHRETFCMAGAVFGAEPLCVCVWNAVLRGRCSFSDTLHLTLDTLHSKLDTLQLMLYTWHSTLYILHFTSRRGSLGRGGLTWLQCCRATGFYFHDICRDSRPFSAPTVFVTE